MLLEYEPVQLHDEAPSSPLENLKPPISVETEISVNTKRLETWSLEQIGDFARKLGFLDEEKEGGDKIKHFLHLNQV